jgi:hypothetical protein
MQFKKQKNSNIKEEDLHKYTPIWSKRKASFITPNWCPLKKQNVVIILEKDDNSN